MFSSVQYINYLETPAPLYKIVDDSIRCLKYAI